ncbi:hypothetical protein [Paraburkholderia sp. BCC1876]|uniref:hypothetical protein n=1 Tax=Paraburkholderia sp. BCC1876 TaxID=2676303 RepID=UPI00159260E5|nr:hypothetical protein [Paraburkholderia sp. BCC1876]
MKRIIYVSSMARVARSGCAVIHGGCSVSSMRLRQTFKRLDTGYPAVVMMGGQTAIRSPNILPSPIMIDSFARVSGWQQLYHLWELIVMLCKFLWGLLRFLGGG